MELSSPDLLCTVQFRTLLYCTVQHCVTPPSAVLILLYNIIIIFALSVIIDGDKSDSSTSPSNVSVSCSLRYISFKFYVNLKNRNFIVKLNIG